MGAIGLAAAGVNLGVDQPGTDRRHANTFAGDFERQAQSKAVDRALRGGVIHIGVG